jgi:lipoprotein-anchoring transpeptidase ErfK/SrfK
MVNRRVILIGIAVCVAIIVLFGLSRKNTGTFEVTAGQDKAAQQFYDQALGMIKNREMVKAKKVLLKIFAEYPDFDKIENVQEELEKLNMQIIFSNTPTPKSVVHEVKSGDTLGKLASQYGTTVELIKTSNHLSSNIIRVGQKLRIWTGSFNILVDKSQNILLLKDGSEVLKVYHVSTGESSSTPVGQFKIVNKLVDPVWFNRGVVVPPESPENVLGSRWLGFDIPGYGIHGTIEPETIGQPITAGCVRMYNREVEELYNIIPIGTEVVIVD